MVPHVDNEGEDEITSVFYLARQLCKCANGGPLRRRLERAV